MKHNTVWRWTLLLLLSSMGISKSWAQAPQRQLNLQEAIDLSLKNSSQLKYSTAKIEEATGALREALDRRLPDAKVSGSYLRLTNPTLDLKIKTGGSGGGGGGETPKVNQAMYGLANASLPIYAGLRIRYGIESAKYLADAAKLDADQDTETIIHNTIDAY